MEKFHNLSDGMKDGFALFYIKDEKFSVLLNEEQAQLLDLTLGIVFKDGKARIVLADKEIKKTTDKERG